MRKENVKNFRVLFNKVYFNSFLNEVWKIIKIALILLWKYYTIDISPLSLKDDKKNIDPLYTISYIPLRPSVYARTSRLMSNESVMQKL